MTAQPKSELLESLPQREWIGIGILAVGVTLVLSSTYQLGLPCTFLGASAVTPPPRHDCAAGDYFGILLDAPATGFPFNVLNDPMYVGTALNFLGEAVRCATCMRRLRNQARQQCERRRRVVGAAGACGVPGRASLRGVSSAHVFAAPTSAGPSPPRSTPTAARSSR